LVVYDPEASADENQAAMASAAEAVVAGEVTQAVRDAPTPRGPVRAGDWIGLRRGEGIVSAGATAEEAATALLERLLTPERELLTVITGVQATRAATDAVLAWLTAHRPAVEVEVHEGGQPLYPFLFGAE
jgi:dihydroxyacetone kinase-like predicted kinase